jgi:hypothetical protein
VTQGGSKQLSLCCGRPDDVTRPITVAEAGTIEDDDAVVLSRQLDQSAGFKILDHAAIAVQ